LPEVADLMGVHARTIRRWLADGIFPKPFRIGHQGKPRLRWRASDLEKHLDRVQQSATVDSIAS
jgi:predicted DNA-binding transcriptional regulator AlpA